MTVEVTIKNEEDFFELLPTSEDKILYYYTEHGVFEHKPYIGIQLFFFRNEKIFKCYIERDVKTKNWDKEEDKLVKEIEKKLLKVPSIAKIELVRGYYEIPEATY